MKQITVEMIRKLEPCYDPTKYIDETWTGTIIDVLNLEAVPEQNRLWLVLREDFLSDKLLRLFAVNCARKVQHLCHDKRSHDAIDAAEKFANGQITSQELAAARAAAWAAWGAEETAWAVAWGAAWAAEETAWAAAGAAQIQDLKKMISEMPEEVK